MSPFKWADLPADTADLVLRALACQLRAINELGNRDAIHSARLVNHAFKDAVAYLWQLYPSMVWEPRCAINWRGYDVEGRYVQRTDAAPKFVEGVLRLVADAAAGRFGLFANTYSVVYTTVYTYGTQYPPHNGSVELYNAIDTVARTLAAEGTFRQLDTEHKREVFVAFLSSCFTYLDRYYVRRSGLRDVKTVLREALVN